jgi:hypothetical protein
VSISLAAHALLVAAVSLVRERSTSAQGAGGDVHSEFFIRVGFPANRPTASQPRRVPAAGEGSDIVDAKVLSAPVQPSPEGPALGGLGMETTGRENPPGGSGRSKGAMGRGLLAVAGTARRIIYLVDRSVSMGPSGALATAVGEVAASLQTLPPNALFQVIPYNRMAVPLELDGQRGLAPADPATIENAIEQLAHVQPAGATDTAGALSCAMLLRPDVVFMLTDADDLPAARLPSLGRLMERAVVHVVELSRVPQQSPAGPLARFARSSGGTYRRVVPEP